jgi:ribosomal protein S18 acetylase RimI-like enzyme
MSVGCRPMRAGEEEAVAAMLRQLPKDIGLAFEQKVTGQSLRDASDVARVTIAEDSGLLLGCCLWMMAYSSMRACKGIYICDLYVMKHGRGRKVGDKLLRHVARESAKQGAQYIKLEVDVTNDLARGFYTRRQFKHKADDQFWILEPDEFEDFVKG